MFPFILGALGGVAAAGLIARRRFRRRHGGFGGGRMWWLARALDLDAQQRAAVEDVLQGVRAAARSVKSELHQEAGALVDDFAGERFDRGKVEAAAGKLDEVRKRAIDGLERLHAILTPAQ